MSRKEFRIRYICNASHREIRMAVTLAMLSGVASVAIAEVPVVADAVKAAEAVGGMSAQTLLGLITLGSLALSGYLIRMHMKQVVALTEISDRLRGMRCIRDDNGVDK